MTGVATFIGWIALVFVAVASHSEAARHAEMPWARALALTLTPAIAILGAILLMANIAGISWAQ